MFKQGAFVNIVTSDSKQWRAALKNLDQFPSLDHIELWLEYIPSGKELKEIRSAFRDFRVIVHGPFLHTSLVSHIPAIVAITESRFDKTVEFASNIGAHVVTFHAGTYPLFECKEDVLHKLASRFHRFTKIKGPIATLENMPVKPNGTTRQAIGRVSDYDKMLKLLPDLHFTLDIGHCLQNEDDFVLFLRKYSSRIENIHLHDGIPGGKGHLRLGAGSLDLDRFLDTLIAVSYDRYVSMETISPEDTRSSWQAMRNAELLKGIRDSSPAPPTQMRRALRRR